MVATAGVTASTTQTRRRYVYDERTLINTLNHSTPLFSLIKKKAREQDQGISFIKSYILAANHGGGLRGENDDMSPASDIIVKEAHFTYAMNHQIVSQTLFAQMAGGFKKGGDMQTSIIDQSVMTYMERCGKTLHMPKTGLMTAHSATAGTGSTVIRVASNKFLDYEMLIDVLLNADGTVGSGVSEAKIIGIEPVTGSTDWYVTLNKSVGAYASLGSTYGLYIHGSYNRHPHGLADINSNVNPAGGPLGGIIDRSVAANGRFRALVHDAGGTRPDAKVIDQFYRTIKQRSPADAKTGHILLCDEAMANYLVNEGAERVDFRPQDNNPFQLFGYSVRIGALDILVDKYAEANTIQVLRPQDIEMTYPKEIGMMFWWPTGSSKAKAMLDMYPLFPKFHSFQVLCGFYAFSPYLCTTMGKITNHSLPAPVIVNHMV